MEDQGYEIKLAQFEGPFDLLLFFIERDELNIHDIPIAKITTDFLDYVQRMQALNMELASEFIIVAATLMRIKAKMLLPRPEPEEGESELDLREDLVQKLILYKQFKLVVDDLRELESVRFTQAKRGNIAVDLKEIDAGAHVGEELGTLDLYKLMVAYERAMEAYEGRTRDVRHTVVRYPYTIEEQKATIAKLVEANQRLEFAEILKHSENRVHFVYNFLAVLEMLQQQLIDIQVGLGYNQFSIRPVKR